MKIQHLLLIQFFLLSCSLATAQTTNQHTLSAGQALNTGEKLTSANGEFYLIMRTDGNLCIYRTANNGFVWCNMVHGFSGATLKMQRDGHLVVYDKANQAKWASKTHPYFDKRFRMFKQKPTKLVLENNGTLRLYNASGKAVWSNKDGVIISDESQVVKLSPTSKAQMDAFFSKNGGRDNYGKAYIDALTTMIAVEDLVKANDYATAKKELDKLWKAYPVGERSWGNSKVDDRKNKTNVGYPTAYYALRMLTDIVEHHLKHPNPTGKVLTATLRVVLVECSEGKQPQTVAEMENGGGKQVKRKLDYRLKANNHRIIDQSLDLFLEYITAITDGQLKVEVKYYDVKNYCAPTEVSKEGTHANLKYYGKVLDQVPQDIKEASDWYWILYPSSVPEDGVDGVATNAGFDDRAFITGGMGGYGNNKPVFIIDDKWLVRVPPHMGKGSISDIERRAYLPQWLQHEFFHHLYRSYPELKLEVKGHDWFVRRFWARDFDGVFEPDYYHQTLHKRLKKAKPYLKYVLKPTYKPSERFLNALTMDQFVNKTFDHADEVRKRGETPNDWHTAKIIKESGKYYWQNKANVKWEVVPDFKNGIFRTKSDNPYQGQNFHVAFEADETGNYTGQIKGLQFQGALYRLKE